MVECCTLSWELGLPSDLLLNGEESPGAMSSGSKGLGEDFMAKCQPSIFVVESYEGCRVGIEAVLANAEYRISTFDNSQACLELLQAPETKCDLIIMGLRLCPVGGLEFIRKIRMINPCVPLIVLTSSGNATVAIQALRLGVSDFMEKPVTADCLISSVQKALAEGHSQHLPLKSLLTKTEYEILMHILDGQSTKQIATKRHRSIRTVEDQRSAIMQKLEVDNLIDLVKRSAFVVMPDEIRA